MTGEPKFFGVYRGSVDNTADPSNKGRLRIKVMSVNGGGALDWALPCFPFLTQQPKVTGTAGDHTVAGKTDKITLRLPKRGDPVWVMFEGGDYRKPIWLGTWIGV